MERTDRSETDFTLDLWISSDLELKIKYDLTGSNGFFIRGGGHIQICTTIGGQWVAMYMYLGIKLLSNFKGGKCPPWKKNQGSYKSVCTLFYS